MFCITLWDRPWDQVLDWSQAPFAKWFTGGMLNASVNCVDRHVGAGYGDRVAYYWEGEPGDERVITYAELKDAELKDEVCRTANALTELGVHKGDRVATRSGKIMRRLLRDVAENRSLGDVTTGPTARSWT